MKCYTSNFLIRHMYVLHTYVGLYITHKFDISIITMHGLFKNSKLIKHLVNIVQMASCTATGRGTGSCAGPTRRPTWWPSSRAPSISTSSNPQVRMCSSSLNLIDNFKLFSIIDWEDVLDSVSVIITLS